MLCKYTAEKIVFITFSARRDGNQFQNIENYSGKCVGQRWQMLFNKNYTTNNYRKKSIYEKKAADYK